MKISIVIPVYNKWNFTRSCLKDLSLLPTDHEIIIIDNASTDETHQEMRELERSLQMKDNLVYIRNEENVFHSKACNQGYQRAKADVVLFMNNDIRVKSNHQSWPSVFIDSPLVQEGLVGPTMGQLDSQLNFVREANQQLTGNSYIGGWCLAASKKVLKQLEVKPGQVWNEEFPMYFNDTDLSFRARAKGIPLNVVPLSDVVHFGKISAAQINIAKLYKEGRQVFLKKWQK